MTRSLALAAFALIACKDERALMLPPVAVPSGATKVAHFEPWQPVDPSFRGCEGG